MLDTMGEEKDYSVLADCIYAALSNRGEMIEGVSGD